MKITIEWIREKLACREGVDWFKNQSETNAVKILEKLIAADKLDWANWTICRLFKHKQQIQYAVYAAEQVINIYEKKYPIDAHPREAIEAAKKYLNTQKNRNAAAAYAVAAAAAYAVAAYASDASAAYASAAASYASDASAAYADAAAAAASDSSAAAAYASDASVAYASAAYASAASAAYAAKNIMKFKILKYGIELLREQNDKIC